MNEAPLLGNSSYLARGRGKDKQPRKVRTPTADPTLQHLAQKENFALFSLASMKGQLNAVRKVESIQPARILSLEALIESCILSIKGTQDARKAAKTNKKGKQS